MPRNHGGDVAISEEKLDVAPSNRFADGTGGDLNSPYEIDKTLIDVTIVGSSAAPSLGTSSMPSLSPSAETYPLVIRAML